MGWIAVEIGVGEGKKEDTAGAACTAPPIACLLAYPRDVLGVQRVGHREARHGVGGRLVEVDGGELVGRSVGEPVS